MPRDAKKVFYELLRDRFAPELRKLGFKGSGSNFRRIRADVISTINIQGNKYGGSSAVNFGLHLTFLPLYWNNELPEVPKIKEVDCEFRDRLAPKGESDYWWKYGGLLSSPSSRVDHLVKTYMQVGEVAFSQFDTVEKVAGMISIDDVSSKRFIKVFGGVTDVRAALTMARVHLHLGKFDTARQFADVGLKNLGRATVLRPQFLKILEQIRMDCRPLPAESGRSPR